jgi:CRISPR-associated protein Cas2
MKEPMYTMISYDVKDDKRRNKVHKLLKNYGEWMQYSVFECQLDDARFQEVQQRLEPLIKANQGDSLCCYVMCEDCHEHIEHLGGHRAQEDGGVVL